MENLQETIALLRYKLDVIDPSSTDVPALLADLGNTLGRQYGSTGRLEDLQEAIVVLRRALDALPAGSPERPAYLKNLGTWLELRYESTEQIEDLAEANAVHREAARLQRQLEAAVALTAETAEAAALQLVRATIWYEPYLVIRQRLDLADERVDVVLAALRDRAREAGEEPLARTCEEQAGLLRRCRQIGVQATFIERFGCTPSDLQQIEAMSQVWPSVHDTLREADGHVEQYRRCGDVRSLDAASACWERVLSDPRLEPAPLVVRCALWSKATVDFRRMSDACDELSYLDRSVELARQAVGMLPRESSNRPPALANLSVGLTLRYKRAARLEDLEEAVALWREAVDTCSPDAPSWPWFLGNFCDVLQQQYKRTGRNEDIDEAVAIGRRIVEIAPTDPYAVQELVDALLLRYSRSGMWDDLDEAIAVVRQHVGCLPLDSPHRAGSAYNLGLLLHLRYERTGRIDDLEQAIVACRQAVDASAPVPTALTALGDALQQRHGCTGRMEDLHEAITLYRQAAETGDPSGLYELASALHYRYEHTHRLEDLQESIALCRQAMGAMRQDDPRLPRLLGILGGRLLARYERTGSIDDLQEATATCRLAVDLHRSLRGDAVSKDDPSGAMCLGNLGNCTAARYNHTRRMEDLEEAIAIQRQAIDAMSLNFPRRPRFLIGLASCIRERYERTGTTIDLQEAISLSRQALELGRTLEPGIALRTACMLGSWSFQRSAWEEAASIYAEALAIVDELYESQLLRSDKLSWLRPARALYAEAAYSLARSGDLRRAALTLETGRARALSDMLDRSRADLEQIEEHAPEVVHRYRQALTQLGQLERMTASAVKRSGNPEVDGRLPARIREAQAELQSAVGAIRATAGGASFLARPSEATLVAALDPGIPVIYVAATSAGGMALVVSRATGGLDVTPLWLDALTTRAVDDLLQGDGGDRSLESWLRAYSRWRQRPDDGQARAIWHASIQGTARALWDLVMGPVVTLVRERFAASAQAVLIPDGLLALLPLHAAWTDEAGPPRWALDEVAFRYAPSMRALAHVRDIAGMCGETRLLVVDEPSPTSAPPLPNSRHEAEAVAAQFARHDVRLLAGDRCRRDDVLGAIADAHVCHFSCHGRNDWDDPLQSGLVMANDEMLTVEDLFALPGRHARLAVLSACETGIVGTEVPNEVVALPAAFVQAGFAGVVASLWSVYDISASLLMARFYELWRTERLSPAVALRRAQIWLRELTNHDLVAHLEQLVPELASKMPLEAAEALHLRALLSDPDARPFAHPAHWAAFCLTGV